MTASFCRTTGSGPSDRLRRRRPFVLELGGVTSTVDYEPGESRSGLFGGNSNWRGPVWFPINYLLIEALQKFDHYYGPEFLVGAQPRVRPVDDPRRRRRGPRGTTVLDLPARRGRQAAEFSGPRGPTVSPATIPSSSSISTGIPARGWEPATRQAGPVSSRSCWSRPPDGGPSSPETRRLEETWRP